MQEQKREFTGVWIPRQIIEDERLKPIDKLLYAEIACFNVCYKKSEELMERCGVKRDTFMASCKRLEKLGYLSQKRKFGKIFRQALVGFPKETPTDEQSEKPTDEQSEKPTDEQSEKPTVLLDNTIENTLDNTILQTDVCEVIPDLLKDKQKHIQIIGLYARAKKVEFENKEQQQSFIKRNLRASNDLIGYNFQRIVDTMNYLMLNADFKWTLESVAKYIDEDTSKLKSNQSEEDEIKSFFDKY